MKLHLWSAAVTAAIGAAVGGFVGILIAMSQPAIARAIKPFLILPGAASISISGAIVNAIYGAIGCFIIALIGVWIYNYFVDVLPK